MFAAHSNKNSFRNGNHTKIYSKKEDCVGWVMFCGWTTNGYHNRHYTGRFQVSREHQVDQELTG